MKRKIQIKKEYVLIGIATIALFFLIIRNFYAYNQYLIREQQKDFLRLAKMVTYGLEEQLNREKDGMNQFFHPALSAGEGWELSQEEELQTLEHQMRQYLSMAPSRRHEMLLTDQEGTILRDIRDGEEGEFFTESAYPYPDELGTETVLGKACKIGEHEYVVPIIKPVHHGGQAYYLILLMDMDEMRSYLNRVVEDEKENGYVALKNQEGYILSHKNPEQIGLHMVRGRKEKYPDLDLSYLDELETMQLSGEEDTYVYDSYWFGESEIKKGKKVATFTPMYLDHEFWVVTINLDYQTYLVPLQHFMQKGIGLSACALLLLGVLLFLLNQEGQERKKMVRENHYLQELNGAMSELAREREQRIHARKLSQIGTMTGKIAHDFRNFLMPVMGYAEFLLMDQDLTGKARQDAEKIMEYALKASQLTDQIAKLSRHEKTTAEYTYFDMVRELPLWLESVAMMLPKQIHLQTEILPEHAWVYGNQTQLQEVIWNLCSNARDAMKEAGGDLHILVKQMEKTEAPEDIRVSQYDERLLCIFVKDSGCGIEPAALEHLFDSFFTTKPAGEGTGLGLSISYDIICQHGGDIRVETEVGTGSCFAVYLPYKEQEPKREPDGSTRTIMLLSDKKKLDEMKYFKKFGYESKVVNITREGVKELEAHGGKYKYIFLETEQGDIEDNELFMYICRNYPEIHVFVITEVVTRQIMDLKTRGMIAGYLKKPFSKRDVEELMKQMP